MIRPHGYQTEALKALTKVRRQGKKRALVVMASGLGKTITAALDVKRYLKKHPRARVLYLCHQNDILEQAQKEFAKVLGWKNGDRYGFFTGFNRKNAHEATIVFASFQTMHEWRTEFKPSAFDYIVVDESHHTHADTYRPTVLYFKPKFLLGITATPDRMDFQDIREVYGMEVFNLPLEEALPRGLLTKVDYRLVTDELHNLGVLDTPVGRLSVKYLNRSLFVPKRDEEIVKLLHKHMRGIKKPRTMIFCRTVQHCDRMAKEIPGAIAIHYRLTGMEQWTRLQAFRKGGAHTVLTVDKFNEGIDIPEANIVVFMRSTSSETILLQQLGRGLRKVRGKHKVLVLDFVANCERLEMVHRLWSKVREPVARHGRYGTKPAVEVDIGKVKFTEVAKRVLDVLEAVKGGYTREMLIGQLQRLAKELGRMPSARDIARLSKAGRCAGVKAFVNHFGSVVAAQQAAGFEGTRTASRYTREMLIGQLRQLAQELGRTPSKADIARLSKMGRCAHPATFRREFNTIPAAQEAAGLSKYRRNIKNTRTMLILQLLSLAKKLRRVPSALDIKNASKLGECASAYTFEKEFGSVPAARRVAELERYRCPKRKKHLFIKA